MARASTARGPGKDDARIERTWQASSPMSATSPATSIATAAPAEERSRGSK
jgi:hypothetical protein